MQFLVPNFKVVVTSGRLLLFRVEGITLLGVIGDPPRDLNIRACKQLG